MNIYKLITHIDNEIHYLEECGNSYNEDLTNVVLEFTKDIYGVVEDYISSHKLSKEDINYLFRDTKSDFFRSQREEKV